MTVVVPEMVVPMTLESCSGAKGGGVCDGVFEGSGGMNGSQSL